MNGACRSSTTAALFEKLMLDGFQAGLSWITILRKRENFRRAFAGFDPAVIARFGAEHVEALMGDAGIVRNRAKIVGTIAGARAWLAIQERQGFATFLWGFVDGRPVQNNLASRADIRPENDDLARDLQGAQGRGLQLRRPDHRLCLHAGGRHGQRPPHRLLPPCAR